MATRPLPARMAVIRGGAATAPAPTQRREDDYRAPELMHLSLRPCAVCGGESQALVDADGEDRWLCVEPGCGALADAAGALAMPAAWAGTDTVRDVAHEMERERPGALERAETRADDRFTGGRKLDYLY
jgi:hypothetical protein